MGRAELRRKIKDKSKLERVPTYNLTKFQLDMMVQKGVHDALESERQRITNDAVNSAMVLLLTLPLEVLMDHYWKDDYASKIPEFTNYVLEYYRRWQDGELDMDLLKEDLWNYGGVKLEEGERDETISEAEEMV